MELKYRCNAYYRILNNYFVLVDLSCKMFQSLIAEAVSAKLITDETACTPQTLARIKVVILFENTINCQRICSIYAKLLRPMKFPS